MMGFVICRIMNTYIDRYMRVRRCVDGIEIMASMGGGDYWVYLWNIYFSLSRHKCIQMKCIYTASYSRVIRELFASYFVYF